MNHNRHPLIKIDTVLPSDVNLYISLCNITEGGITQMTRKKHHQLRLSPDSGARNNPSRDWATFLNHKK